MKSVQLSSVISDKTSQSFWPAGVAYINHQLVPIQDAKIPILDWGFLHSDATYDVAHVWQGKFFRIDDHIDRFFAGMDRLHMDCGLSKAEVKQVMVDCVVATGLKDAYVEIICTRGQPAPGSRDPRTCDQSVLGLCHTLCAYIGSGQARAVGDCQPAPAHTRGIG